MFRSTSKLCGTRRQYAHCMQISSSGCAAAGGYRLGLTLATLCLAVLVAQIDTAVVNLAMRAIGDDLGAGIAALQWILDGYNLVYAALLLTGGLLADLFGRRRVFMAGAGVFTLASLLCAVAPSVPILIVGRVLAGAAAALLIPASLAIIRVVWRDPAERGRALGIWAACNGLAMAVAPTVGGLLIESFGWRSIFLIVVPVSALAFVLAAAVVSESADPQGRQFDGLAQALGALALGGLAFAAIQARDAPQSAIAALILAPLALVWFVHVEAGKRSAALVPLDIFRSRTFCGAAASTTGMTFGMYGALFLLPLVWLSSGRLSAPGAGIALIPMSLIFVLVSSFSGALTERLGARAMAAGGVAVIGGGLVAIGASAGSLSIIPSEIGLVLAGLGMGLATGPLMAYAVGAVAAERSGTASALINVARMVGATVGVAVLGVLYAMTGGGSAGLRMAMLLGGAAQLASAAVAWWAMRAH